MKTFDIYLKLKELKDDPIKFAARKKEIIDEAIAKCPSDQQELYNQKQWRLDRELDKFKNPIARMNRMTELFWQGVYKFEDTLRSGSIEADPRTHKDSVVPFKKK